MRVIELVIRRFKKGRQQVVRLYVPTRRRLTRDFEEELCYKFQCLVEGNHEAFAWQDEPVSNDMWDSDDWEYDTEEVNEIETKEKSENGKNENRGGLVPPGRGEATAH